METLPRRRTPASWYDDEPEIVSSLAPIMEEIGSVDVEVLYTNMLDPTANDQSPLAFIDLDLGSRHGLD